MTDGDRADIECVAKGRQWKGIRLRRRGASSHTHMNDNYVLKILERVAKTFAIILFSFSTFFTFCFPVHFFCTDSTCVIFAPFAFCGLYSIVCKVFKYCATS